MPNVKTKIKSLYASLSPAYKQLADYICSKTATSSVPFGTRAGPSRGSQRRLH